MLIKSLIKRENGSKIQFGQEGEPVTEYHFTSKTKDGDHVCEVTDKKHIQQFLSIQEGYEIADDEPVSKAKNLIKRMKSHYKAVILIQKSLNMAKVRLFQLKT